MKCLLLTLAFLLVLSAQVPVVKAQSKNPNVLATNLPGTRTIAAPPAGFDPLTAGDAELAYWGFPPRPNPAESPENYATWARAMRASKTRIMPQLKESKIKPWHGHNRPAKGPVAEGEATLQSGNWGGFIHRNGAQTYGSSSFYYVIGTTIVPVAQQAFGTCSGSWDYAGNWIGLGGWDEEALLQAGFEYDAYCNGSDIESAYVPFYEFYPANPAVIDNFPISPGDDIFMEVWQTSPTEGHAYLTNLNTYTSVNLGYDAPSGTGLISNSAEWITESLAGTPLVNFISDFFWGAAAYTEADTLADPGNSNPIVIVDENNNPVGYPTKGSKSAFQMQDEGSAY